jgi:hypothetical protein
MTLPFTSTHKLPARRLRYSFLLTVTHPLAKLASHPSTKFDEVPQNAPGCPTISTRSHQLRAIALPLSAVPQISPKFPIPRDILSLPSNPPHSP